MNTDHTIQGEYTANFIKDVNRGNETINGNGIDTLYRYSGYDSANNILNGKVMVWEK